MWIIIGASAGLGRALAEALAESGREQLLVARDRRDLEALAADLRIRHGTEVRIAAFDATDPAALASEISAEVEGLSVDGILFPIGAVSDLDRGTLGPPEAERLVRVNLLAVVAVVSRLLPAMIARRGGVIVGFGSIAAVRGRDSNVVYSAAKRALESYFESLRHLTAGTGVVVALYRLGYLDTQLSFGRRLLLPKANPRTLARRICARLGRDEGAFVLPSFWAPLLWVIRRIPWAIYARARF